MAEEQVVLTTTLKDEISAPLDRLQKKIDGTADKAVSAAKRQASGTSRAMAQVTGSMGAPTRSMERLQRVFSQTQDRAGVMARGVGSSVKNGITRPFSTASQYVQTTGSRMFNRLPGFAQSGMRGAASAVSAGAGSIAGAGGRIRAGFSNAFTGVQERARGIGDSLRNQVGGGASAATGMVKMLGGVLGALSVAKLAQVMSSAVESYSALEDATAAASTIYADMDKIIALSKDAGEALGMNQSQVIAAAQTYGVYGQSAGLAGKELETFSTDLITRAGDMASFFGKSPEQAIEAIGAAMRGETEPIRAFGVMLDDAAMRQKALEMGLVSTTTEALEPQNKVLAAQALIMEKSNNVAGDFNNTMNSTANVQKRLQAATENTSAKLGQVLAPMFTAVRLKALDGVNGISAFLDRVLEAQAIMAGGGTTPEIAKALGFSERTTAIISEALGSIYAFRAGIAEGGEVTSGGVSGFFERVGIAIHNLRARLAEFSGSQWAVVAGGATLLLHAFGGLTPILGLVVGVFARLAPFVGVLGGALRFLLGPIGLIASLFLMAYATSEPFRVAIGGLLTAVMGLGQTLFTTLVPVFTTLVTALLPVITGLLTSIVPIFIQLAMAIIPVATTLISQLVPVIVQLISMVLPVFISLITMLAPIFLQLLTALAPIVATFIGQFVPVLMQIITAILPVFMQLLTTLAPLFATVVAAVLPVVASLLSGLVPVLMQLISAVLPPVMGLLTTLAPIFTQLVGAVMPLIPPIAEIIGALIRLAVSAITPLMPLIRIVATLLTGVLGGALELVMPIVGFLIDKFASLVTFLEGPLSGAIGFVSDLFSGIAGIIEGAAGAVSDFFNNPLGGLQDMFGGGNSGGGVYASGGAVAGFAGGGTVPGYAPGRDTVPAMLSRGESVLVPELTALLGPANIMRANKMASGGGRPAGAGPSAAPLPPLPGGGRGGGGGYQITFGPGSVVVTVEGDGDPDTIKEAVKEAIDEAIDEAQRRGY